MKFWDVAYGGVFKDKKTDSNYGCIIPVVVLLFYILIGFIIFCIS